MVEDLHRHIWGCRFNPSIAKINNSRNTTLKYLNDKTNRQGKHLIIIRNFGNNVLNTTYWKLWKPKVSQIEVKELVKSFHIKRKVEELTYTDYTYSLNQNVWCQKCLKRFLFPSDVRLSSYIWNNSRMWPNLARKFIYVLYTPPTLR